VATYRSPRHRAHEAPARQPGVESGTKSQTWSAGQMDFAVKLPPSQTATAPLLAPQVVPPSTAAY
jgi:hypothetical protein